MLFTRSRILWINSLARGFRAKMLYYFILELLSIICSLAFVYFSKKAVDFALDSDFVVLKQVVIAVVVSSLIGVLCKIFSQRLSQVILIKLMSKIQNEILYKQMTSIWRVIKKWNTGDVLVRLNSDVSEIVQMIGLTWMNVILTVVKLIASFVFLYTMDSKLAFIIIGISPIFLLSKVYFQKMRYLNRNIKTAESDLGGMMQENLKFRGLIRSLGIIEYRYSNYLNKQEKYIKMRISALNFSMLTQTILKYTVNIGYLTVFIWGVFRLHEGEITFGTMTAFLQLVAHIQSPVLSLLAVVPAFVRFGVSMERILELKNVEVEPISAQEKFEHVNSIQLNKVNFSYDNDLILENLNFNIRKGESVAVVGGSGKGKTTFIRLLLAVLKPDAGDILVENESGKKFSVSTSHNINFCYVPQGNTLFTGTVRDNLLINAQSVDEEILKQVLFVACAEFVYNLPNGIDTVVGESGLGLSEGQAQRIAIARALLKGGSVLLLDEPTSALDDNTREMFIDRIFSFTKDKIVIFVTHDTFLAQRCDQTILIN